MLLLKAKRSGCSPVPAHHIVRGIVPLRQSLLGTDSPALNRRGQSSVCNGSLLSNNSSATSHSTHPACPCQRGSPGWGWGHTAQKPGHRTRHVSGTTQTSGTARPQQGPAWCSVLGLEEASAGDKANDNIPPRSHLQKFRLVLLPSFSPSLLSSLSPCHPNLVLPGWNWWRIHPIF